MSMSHAMNYIFFIRLRITIGIYVELVVVFLVVQRMGKNERDSGMEVSVTVKSFSQLLVEELHKLMLMPFEKPHANFSTTYYFYSDFSIPESCFSNGKWNLIFFPRVTVSFQTIRIHLITLELSSNG